MRNFFYFDDAVIFTTFVGCIFTQLSLIGEYTFFDNCGMSDFEQQNLYGGKGIVRLTLHPEASVGCIKLVQQYSLEPDADIGRHCTPGIQRLLIGVDGIGEIRADDVSHSLESGVVLTVAPKQTLQIQNLSSTKPLQFWLIQLTKQ